jgi:hypothetical protein
MPIAATSDPQLDCPLVLIRIAARQLVAITVDKAELASFDAG